jgi:DNA-binding MarR family transcriptional regulator
MTLPSQDARAVAEWLVWNHKGESFDCDNEALVGDIAQVLADFRAERKPRILGLTPRQARVLEFLTEEEERCALVPSFEEIGRYCALHKSGVHRVVHALAKRGAIRIEPGQRRSIEVIGRAGEMRDVSTAHNISEVA